MEDWAEIRRLHRSESVPIREIARRLGLSRNTVRSALASDRPPRYERQPRGSVADDFEPQIRALLLVELSGRVALPASVQHVKRQELYDVHRQIKALRDRFPGAFR